MVIMMLVMVIMRVIVMMEIIMEVMIIRLIGNAVINNLIMIANGNLGNDDDNV